MDAIKYLRQEHSKFRRNLNAISKVSNPRLKKTKFGAFCKDLLRHERMEQRAWYPVLRKHAKLRQAIKHLISEEKSAAKAIQKFKNIHFEFMWNLRFHKLKHDVDHHAREEETELFPQVRKLLSKTELNKLGTSMRKFKAKLRNKI